MEAQIQGKVYRDFNASGTFDSTATFKEIGLMGITVTAYSTAGISVGSTLTDATGNYTIAAVTGANRVEFTGLASGDYAAPKGSGNNTSIQFVTAPTTSVNFGVNYPDDYWDNTTQAIPQMLLPCYVGGSITAANKNEAAIVAFGNDQNGLSIAKTVVAKHAEVGSVWGNAYQKNKDRFFYSAFLKRHTGEGPKGLGGVYIVEKVSGNYAVAASFTLQGVMPANSATAIDIGSVTRSTTVGDDNYIASSTSVTTEACRDLDAFGKVGTISFGDCDMDTKQNLLFLVNLNQKSIVTVDVSGSTTLLNNASAATLAPLTKTYNIASLPNVPSCGATGNLRPWALKIYKDRGYLGVVCDANTSQVETNLAGYILSFDPANIPAGFQVELALNLDYRGSGNSNWKPWASTYAQTGLSATPGTVGQNYSQPYIGDIEFDERGGMIIAFGNRFGHQMGYANYLPITSSTTIVFPLAYGDILYACKVGAGYVMEGTAAACTTNGYDPNKDYANGNTPSTGEYFNDNVGDSAVENGMGSLAKLMGTQRVVMTVNDPYPPGGTTGNPYLNSGGVHWFDVIGGNWTQYAQLYGDQQIVTYGKVSGLGDIEFALNPPPIEIGNRVWQDADQDGIQDAGESGIDGVTVKLKIAGITQATTITANGGQYIFTGLLTNTNYTIEIENFAIQTPLNNSTLTTANVSSNANDLIDNDATMNGVNAVIAYQTGLAGENNHSLDIGFITNCKSPICLPLSITRN